jgi:hypothetical protein
MKTSPKAEIRMTKEIRSANAEWVLVRKIRISEFGLVSGFDIRISDFNYAH